MLTTSVVSVLVPVALLAPTVNPGPPGCVVVDSTGRCLVEAVDPERPGGPRDPQRGRPPADDEPEAVSTSAVERPRPPRIGAVPFGDGGWVASRPGPEAAVLAEEAAVGAPAPQQVDAPVLAQRAIDLLELTPAEPRFSVADTGYVGLPVWLWIEEDQMTTGPLSATATAGGASVTATGQLTSVLWSMGPPGETVRCRGLGTPWTGQPGASPDCGYTYTQRSLPERTDGTGRWTVTTTSVWTVTWSGFSAGQPVTGEQLVELSAETTLPVGEVQVLTGGESG